MAWVRRRQPQTLSKEVHHLKVHGVCFGFRAFFAEFGMRKVLGLKPEGLSVGGVRSTKRFISDQLSSTRPQRAGAIRSSEKHPCRHMAFS